MNKEYQYEKIFRALGDGHRLTIMKQLSEREMNAGELLDTVDVVQSTLSHHMKTLCEAGLVVPRKKGKWTCYTLDRNVLEDAAAFLQSFGKEDGADPEEKGVSPVKMEAEEIDYSTESAPVKKVPAVKEKGKDKSAKTKTKEKARSKVKEKPKDKGKDKGRSKNREKEKTKEGRRRKKQEQYTI